MRWGYGKPPSEKGHAFLLNFKEVRDFLAAIPKLVEKPGKSEIWIDLSGPEIAKYEWTETFQPRHAMKGLIKTRIGRDSHSYNPTFPVPDFADDLVLDSYDEVFVTLERNRELAQERKKRRAASAST